MRPFTPVLARSELSGSTQTVAIGAYRFTPDLDKSEISETGPDGARRYSIAHVLGGKNVCYFLTPVERGRLQVLPIAYDTRRREWFDTTASAVRHFREHPDQALHWRERPLTFNTACHSCHVSQLSLNYTPGDDTYHTSWREPGINCETCHGPGEAHAQAFARQPKGQSAEKLQIISTRAFSPAQINAQCAGCHAKMIPLVPSVQLGVEFFDQYDLITYEDLDFYPDGRDLGENYTYTQWRSSACVKASQMDCLHCHTSSGRYRFDAANANQACLPCHQDKVSNPARHTHHAIESMGSRCVSCHMPQTEFARMIRTDHSLRPPTPAATLKYQSPNACNLCHTNQTARWADEQVRQWQPRDFQAPVLRRAEWIDAARKQQWNRLPEMLAYLADTNHEEILATSLVRLLARCPSNEVASVFVHAVGDPSPLVRSSAADALGRRLTPQFVESLLRMTSDASRLVRIRAAAALAGVGEVPGEFKPALTRAAAECEAALQARPDDAMSRYNLGNYYAAKGDDSQAITAYRAATRLEPENIPAWANGALSLNRLGSNTMAEAWLRQALRVDPTNAAVCLNLGLLLGEMGRGSEAVPFLRQALKSDPASATAAHNLGILIAVEQPAESIVLLRQAVQFSPENMDFVYTLAFYLAGQKQDTEARQILEPLVAKEVNSPAIYDLLARLWLRQGQLEKAAAVYRQAAANDKLPAEARSHFQRQLETQQPVR